jgi:hypothetical protein
MKKLLIIFLIIICTVNLSYSQVKVNFYLANWRDSVGYLMCDLKAEVMGGQVWHVGATNIRITDSIILGTGSLIPKSDNPALNANQNISNANGYQAMTTTSIVSGTGIGCNILTFNSSGFYTFISGMYRIATLRWQRIPPVQYMVIKFRVPPTSLSTVVYDSTKLLTYNIDYITYEPTILSSNEILTEVPNDFNLYQNYPNPFNPITKIKFDIPKSSFATLKIYDVEGKEMEVLVNQNMEAGTYEFNWDASKLASGIYFYRLTAGDFVNVKKMVLLK